MTLRPQPLLHRLNRSLADLYGDWHGRPTPGAVGEMAGTLLSSNMTVIGHRASDQRHAMQWWPQALDLRAHDKAYEAHVHTHPIRNRYRESKEPGPYSISDVENLATFKAGPLYRDYFRHYGVTRMMAVYVPLTPDSHVSLGVSRDGRDFSDDERLALALFQPHLLAAVQRELANPVPARPPGPVRAVPAGAELTTREAEILRWIAVGKSNPEIAIILGVSRLTVKTHVERILGKLGVENRVAAVSAARAWRV